MQGLEEILGKLFLEKMPPLPTGIKDGIAKILPWIIIILGILGLLATVSILGMFSATMAITSGFTNATGSNLLSTLNLILICAIAPLLQLLSVVAGFWMLKRQLRGWRLALLATLLGFIVHLCSFSLSGILINLIFIYLLFQIREYYTAR